MTLSMLFVLRALLKTETIQGPANASPSRTPVTADALKCHCDVSQGGVNCESKEETCGVPSKCASIYQNEYKIYDNVQLKTCVKYTECGEYSVKIGDYYNNWVVDCCEEDFCNSGNANEPPKSGPNGLVLRL
ncbi:uncharacterized protein LOC144984497 isoform X1 [Oryzias latipes]